MSPLLTDCSTSVHENTPPFLPGSDIINTDGVFLPRGAPGEKHGGSEEERDEKQVETHRMSTYWHI